MDLVRFFYATDAPVVQGHLGKKEDLFPKWPAEALFVCKYDQDGAVSTAVTSILAGELSKNLSVPLGEMALTVWYLHVHLDTFFEEGVMLPEQREEVMAKGKQILQPNDLYERIDLGVRLLDCLVNSMKMAVCASHFNAHTSLPGHPFLVVLGRAAPSFGFLAVKHECDFVPNPARSDSRSCLDDSFNDFWIVRAVDPKFIVHLFSHFWRPFFSVSHHLYIPRNSRFEIERTFFAQSPFKSGMLDENPFTTERQPWLNILCKGIHEPRIGLPFTFRLPHHLGPGRRLHAKAIQVRLPSLVIRLGADFYSCPIL